MTFDLKELKEAMRIIWGCVFQAGKQQEQAVKEEVCDACEVQQRHVVGGRIKGRAGDEIRQVLGMDHTVLGAWTRMLCFAI